MGERKIYLLFNVFVFMRPYKNLKVYKRALDLVDVFEDLMKRFPEYETYELSRQMRKSVGSISMNISEGSLRRTSADFISFLHNSLGSAGEVETQVEIADRKRYLKTGEKEILLKELDEIKKMLYGLIKWVRKKDVR